MIEGIWKRVEAKREGDETIRVGAGKANKIKIQSNQLSSGNYIVK